MDVGELDRRHMLAGAGGLTLAAAIGGSLPAVAGATLADAGSLGAWTDWEGLPAYHYTGPIAFHPPAALAARVPDDPWFLLGNHRLTLFVHASGRLRLLSSARGWAAMNGLKGANTAVLAVDGAAHALVGADAAPDLTVAPGAACYRYALPGVEVTRTLATPPSARPGEGLSAVLVTLTLRNTGMAPRAIAYRETLTGAYKPIEAPWVDSSKRVRFESVGATEGGIALVRNRTIGIQPMLMSAPPLPSEYDPAPPMLWAAPVGSGGTAVQSATEVGVVATLTLAPGEARTLSFAFGHADDLAGIIAARARFGTAPPGDAPFARAWNAALPALARETDAQARREARWNAAAIEALTVWREYFGDCVVVQGTTYDFGWGWTGWTRDIAQQALPLARTNPALARSALRYILKRYTPDGESKPADSGYGYVMSTAWSPSDMQLYTFMFAAEYLARTGDASILSERIAWHPLHLGATGTGLEHLDAAFRFARDRVGVGAHGLMRMWNSDWNDMFYYAPHTAPYAVTWGSAESHLNTALAIVVLGRLAPELRRLSPDAGPLADAMAAWRGELLAAFIRDLGDRAFPRRAYLGPDGAVGESEMWLEPAAFALMIPELGLPRRRAIADALFARLAAGEPLGPRQIERAQAFHDLKPGQREDGGIWYALSGPAILGLLAFDPARARDLMRRWSMANFARVHPDLWTGAWSASDSLDSAQLPTAGTSINPPWCAHAHAWPLHCYLESVA